jgi:ABC-type sugar transport system permease subunit
VKGTLAWRVGAALLAALAGLGALGAGQWAARRAERLAARRSAQSAAAYLTVVTPTLPGSSVYDLPRLLAVAHGITSLPGWAGSIEVFHGTAPLIRARAAPLPAATFVELRDREVSLPYQRAMLAPFKDHDDWNVVGAVAVQRDGVAPAMLGVWEYVILALLAVTGALAVRLPRGGTTACVLAALLAGMSGYRQVAVASRKATDQWLGRARALVEDAGVRVPPRAVNATLPGMRAVVALGEVVTTDSGPIAIRRVEIAGVPRAETRARFARSRWLVLRVLPDEVGIGGWRVLCLAIALLGPAAAVLMGWLARARTNPRARRETLIAWVFLSPAALHLAVFAFMPIAFAGYLSFHRWSPIDPVKPFVGLDNFTALAGDPLVWISLRNTLLYSLHVPVAMAIALGLALALQRQSRGAKIARTVFFLPYVSSVVAIALVWQWMYNADFGLLNYLLSIVGLAPVDWLGSPRTALVAVMIVSIWVQVGYQMVVFLAGLQGIPQVYQDAARVDGASAWQRFRHVTLPLLRPVTLFVLVTGVITSFQVFTLIYVLTDGGPLHATDVLVYRIYQMAWEFLQFGGASALSLVLLILLLGVTWVQFRMLGRRIDYA